MRVSIAEALRAIAQAGISLPCRVEVRSARADAGGYVATVAVLDDAGAPTEEVIEDLPLPPGWLGADGRGEYAPPEAGSRMLLVFVGGRRSEPVLVCHAGAAQAPAEMVPEGARALLDGKGARVWLQGDGSALIEDAEGAVVRVAGDRVRIASSSRTLLEALQELCDAIEALQVQGTGNDGRPVLSTLVTALAHAGAGGVGAARGGAGMSDMLLQDRDIAIAGDGHAALVSGAALVAQDVSEALEIPRGSLLWDEAAGSDLHLFLNDTVTPAAVIAELERVARAEPRVDAASVVARRRVDGKYELRFAVHAAHTAVTTPPPAPPPPVLLLISTEGYLLISTGEVLRV